MKRRTTSSNKLNRSQSAGVGDNFGPGLSPSASGKANKIPLEDSGHQPSLKNNILEKLRSNVSSSSNSSLNNNSKRRVLIQATEDDLDPENHNGVISTVQATTGAGTVHGTTVQSVLFSTHEQVNTNFSVSFNIDDPLELAAHQQQKKGRPSLKTRIVNALDLSSSEHPRMKGSGFLASRKDISMNEDDFAGGCKMLLAAARGDVNMLNRILKYYSPRLSVDFRDYDRRTALHVAASEGHLEMVKFLIDKKGAAINRSDRWGGSPLDDAHRHRNTEVASYIRARGGRTGSTDLTANLINAASLGDLDEVILLIEHCGVEVDAGDYDNRTALHLASAADQDEVVQYLLKQGKANPNSEDRWGFRPLDDAFRHDAKTCISLLQASGATRGKSATESLKDSNGGIKTSSIEDDADFKVEFSELEMIERIGGGAFGDIYKCRWRGTLVAAKCIKDAKIAKDWKNRFANQGRINGLEAKQSYKTPSKISLPSSRRSSINSTLADNVKDGLETEFSSAKLPSHVLAQKLELEIENQTAIDFDASNALSSTAKELALQDFITELSILKKLRHPNICLLLGYSYTDDYQVMVSELMKCSLLDVFKANAVHNIIFSMKKQAGYAHQIAAGMNYLHTCKPPIIHRDLKPANILLSYTGTCKITDFGLAKIRADPKTDEKDQFKMTGETGTYRFMAPEVFRHEQYTEKVDIYSFGMILFFMSSGHAPWPSKNGVVAAADAAIEGKRPFIPRNWDSQWANLLQQCWDESPSLRPSFKVVLDMLEQYSNDVLKTDVQIDYVGDDGGRCRGCVIS